MSELMSIVIPVYNRAKELPRTVASIVAQDYRPLHLILVDNNSSDNSLAVCHELQQRYRDEQLCIDVLQQPKPGASAARNMGLAHVNSRYMMFFDSDDELHPDAVSRYMHAFAAHPDVDIVGSTIEFHDGSRSLGVAKAVFTTEPEAHIIHGILSTQRMAARTQLFREVGGWQEEYNGWLDWNLGLRLMLRTRKIVWLKTPPVATVYLHPNSITGRNDLKGYRQFYQALQYTRRDIAASDHPRKLRLERLVIYRQALLAARIVRESKKDDVALRDFSRLIFDEAMNDSLTTASMRLFVPLCLQYASRGGRGSGTIAQWIIR